MLIVEYRILSTILYAKLFDPQEDSCSNNASEARRTIICGGAHLKQVTINTDKSFTKKSIVMQGCTVTSRYMYININISSSKFYCMTI